MDILWKAFLWHCSIENKIVFFIDCKLLLLLLWKHKKHAKVYRKSCSIRVYVLTVVSFNTVKDLKSKNKNCTPNLIRVTAIDRSPYWIHRQHTPAHSLAERHASRMRNSILFFCSSSVKRSFQKISTVFESAELTLSEYYSQFYRTVRSCEKYACVKYKFSLSAATIYKGFFKKKNGYVAQQSEI